MEREWTPRLPRGVRLREDRVRGRWILLAPERIFEIDATGLEILRRCDGRPLASLLADLGTAFGVSPAEIRSDVEAFLSDFFTKRIVDLT